MNKTGSVKKPIPIIIAAMLYTFTVPAIGSVSFGPWTALLFLFGFLGGFIGWMLIPDQVSFASIKVPYWLTFAFFVLHRIKEYVSRFQQTLSTITGVPVPEVTALPLILLLIGTVLAWLVAPLLMQHGNTFGNYLAWTFFASMGITELAHFVLPLFTSQPYGYFPGMASVFLLAPAAWWGMWRLSWKNDA